MQGGVFFTELTLNDRTKLWHPHLHVLFEGRYIPQKLAAKQWLKATGDSFIVDIRTVSTSKGAAFYVAKYASKALSSRVWKDSSRLQEAIITLYGRRTFSTFGTFTKLGLSKQLASDVGWSDVDTLANLMSNAALGSKDALLIMQQLHSDCEQVDIDDTS